MMRIQVDPPRWTRLRLLAWLARVAGIARRWEASGRHECDLLADLARLARRRGFVVLDDGFGGVRLMWLDNKTHEVRS